jgi:hypothetical protein
VGARGPSRQSGGPRVRLAPDALTAGAPEGGVSSSRRCPRDPPGPAIPVPSACRGRKWAARWPQGDRAFPELPTKIE